MAYLLSFFCFQNFLNNNAVVIAVIKDNVVTISVGNIISLGF